MKHTLLFCLALSGLALVSCQRTIQIDQKLDKEASIYPDYKEVTAPVNIAPLNFQVMDSIDAPSQLIIESEGLSFQIKGTDKGVFDIPEDQWHELLQQQKGKAITLTVCRQQNDKWCAYKPFTIQIAPEPIDPYVSYRLIEPGYAAWDHIGIYQRNLETFEESPIYENKNGDKNCVNCHSYQSQNPDKMVMHMRVRNAGTAVIQNGKIEKINSKTNETISGLVYPSWHPTANYVAFTNNLIYQSFFMSHENRLEPFDTASDVVVYNVDKHELTGCPETMDPNVFETYPTFSPDGKYLYYCSARSVPSMPEHFAEVHYNLCRIGFDSEKGEFITPVDTIYNAEHDSLSASLPRVSPDGKYLVFVRHQFGQMSIWHTDSDLYIVDLQTGAISQMENVNSNQAESYHSWSSNSRWMAFSSRRQDGLYGKTYFTYIDQQGRSHKPFLMPQKNPKKFYDDRMRAFNVPELMTGPVTVDQRTLIDKMISDPGINITFKGKDGFVPKKKEDKPSTQSLDR